MIDNIINDKNKNKWPRTEQQHITRKKMPGTFVTTRVVLALQTTDYKFYNIL